jgi:hypothetical protein
MVALEVPLDQSWMCYSEQHAVKHYVRTVHEGTCIYSLHPPLETNSTLHSESEARRLMAKAERKGRRSSAVRAWADS